MKNLDISCVKISSDLQSNIEKCFGDLLKINHFQTYFPILSCFFNFNNNGYSHKCFILNSKYIVSNLYDKIVIKDRGLYIKHIFNGEIKNNYNDNKCKKVIFVKLLPLLDVIPYMMNHYDTEANSNLPNIYHYLANKKINSRNNNAYIDGFGCFLTSKLVENGKCPTFPLFYGTFNGVAEKFDFDITDEYQSIKHELTEDQKSKFDIIKVENDYFSYSEDDSDSSNSQIDTLKIDSILDDLDIDISLNQKDIDSNLYKKSDNEETKSEEEISEHNEETKLEEEISEHNEETKSEEEISEHNEETKSEEEISEHNEETKSEEEISEHNEETKSEEAISEHNENSDDLSDIENDILLLNEKIDEIDTSDIESLNNSSSEHWFTESEDGEDTENYSKNVLRQKKYLKQRQSNSSIETISDVSDISDDLSVDHSYKYSKYCRLNDFPVQIICMESCANTLDELIEDKKYDITETEWLSILFQICFGLSVAQKHIDFVHNDLHSSNIMFCSTDLEKIYFSIKNKFYAIPTFNKITKIIDFGRATFTVNNYLFFSDVFKKNGDAEGQYSYPYHNKMSSCKIKPNKSFDLSRLSSTIIEHFNPDTPIHNLLKLWITDKYGNCYVNHNDDFDLYKKIAKNVISAVPENQLNKKIFNCFRVNKKDIPKDQYIYYL
jgi:hypothetical protein